MTNLADVCNSRENNINIIRFAAAVLVIFGHSFELTQGGGDPLTELSKNQIGSGGLAVSIFFLLGGFLICRSMLKYKTAKAFFKARAMRIIPLLAIVTFTLALVIGPVFTRLDLLSYYTNVGTYKYLLNSVLILVHNLPGVFTSNPYYSTVNGPLWTLPVEFMCYIMCFLLYKMKLLTEKKMKWLFPFAFVLYFSLDKMIGNTLAGAALRPAMLFFVGMICYVYRAYIPINTFAAFVSFLGIILSIAKHCLYITLFIFFVYFILWLAFGTIVKLSKFGRKREISYGMYLSGWPIQQMLCAVTENEISAKWSFIITLILSVMTGFLLSGIENRIRKMISVS